MTVQCRECREWKTVDCTDKQYLEWKTTGALIQTVMPKLSAAERELLISGVCGECFDRMFRGIGK